MNTKKTKDYVAVGCTCCDCDRVAQLNNCRISDVGVGSAGSRGSTSKLPKKRKIKSEKTNRGLNTNEPSTIEIL
jgi:hypothetical protein